MAANEDNQTVELAGLPESERWIEEGRTLLGSVFMQVRQGNVLTEDEFLDLCQALEKMEMAYSAIEIRRQVLRKSLLHLNDAVEQFSEKSRFLPLFLAIWKRNGAGLSNLFSLLFQFRKLEGMLVSKGARLSYQLGCDTFSLLSARPQREVPAYLPEPERLLGESRVLLDSVLEQIRQEEVLFADEFKDLCIAVLMMKKACVTLSIRMQKLGRCIHHLIDVIQRLKADDMQVSIDTQLFYSHASSGYPN